MKAINIYILIFIILASSYNESAKAQSWQWTTRMGGINSDPGNNIPEESVFDMAVDAQGNIYACGRIRSVADFNGLQVTTYGDYDIFLAKFDCLGNPLWVKTAGSGYSDEANALVLDNEGHVYVTGRVSGDYLNKPLHFIDSVYSEPTQDMFLAKFDTAGNFYWVKIGARGNDQLATSGRKMKLAPNGMLDVLLDVGILGSGILFPGDTVSHGEYIMRFDTAGNVIKKIKINSDYNSVIMDFIISQGNDYYVTGWFNSLTMILAGDTLHRMGPTGAEELFLFKIDTFGIAQWVVHIGEPLLSVKIGQGLGLDSNGDVYLSGIADNGTIIGNDTLFNPMNNHNGPSFPFIAKFNSFGVPLWANNIQTQYSSGGIKESGNVTVLNNGNVAFTNQFLGNSLIGSASYSSVNNQDIFIAVSDGNTGAIINSAHLSCDGGNEVPVCITNDQYDNIFIGGAYDGTITMNSTSYPYEGGLTDGFIAKWGSNCFVGINDPIALKDKDVLLYPNPTSGEITVTAQEVSPIAYRIYDFSGRCVENEQTKAEIFHADLSEFPNGLYFLIVDTKNGQLNSKVLVAK